MTRQSQYDKGYAEGYAEANVKRVINSEVGPWEYWHWGEWAVYNIHTVAAILLTLLFIWLSGIYIRWQVAQPPLVYYYPGSPTTTTPPQCTRHSDGWTCP